MKKNFNIAKILDVDVLDTKLDEFEDSVGYAPIILANRETIYEICKSDFETIILNGDKAQKYKGCKFFVDNMKNFGEVELR